MGALRATLALALLVTVTVACADEPELLFETAEVTSGTVVQTVAAPAVIAPRDRVTVSAPVGGEVAQLFVSPGDVVAAGDPLVRLTSDSVDLQISQAEAAVEAAGALGGAAVGVDLSPLITAVRSQYEAVIPDVLAALGTQATLLPEEQRQAALDRIAAAEQQYAATQAELRSAERQARSQAQRATAGQRAAAEAQQQQAQLALDAARDLEDGLTLSAPVGGVVEFASAAAAGGAVPGLGAGAGDLSGLSGLLGGSGTSSSGPLSVGVGVSPGQPLVTIFDLTGFHADVRVDEVDAVAVTEGQQATVLVDAFPDAELGGRVAHVAIEPIRGDTGGVVFPVEVSILTIPARVELRVGLTASAEIVTAEVTADTVVPSSALLRRGGQEVVYAVRSGRAAEVAVEVLAIGDDTAAVRGALEVGEQVVTVGVEDVADGDELPEP